MPKKPSTGNNEPQALPTPFLSILIGQYKFGKTSLLSRRNFIAELVGAGLTFAPVINRLAGAVARSKTQTSSEWPPDTLIWQQQPGLGISQFTAWESGYDNDPFPGMMEFKNDPKGIFPHKGLWCHVPKDLALEDWDSYRAQLMGQENIVLNDWIIMWEDNRHGQAQARTYIKNHLGDMAGVPTNPQEREAFLDFWAEITTRRRVRVYPSPLKTFDEIVPLPCRVEVDFWLGNDWVQAAGKPIDDYPPITNVLSVFDGYAPIALVDVVGPLDNIRLFCQSSGDPRPGRDPSDDTTLELTYEGQTQPIRPNTKISVRCDLWPGSGRDFLVYVRDEIYDPDYVLYAQGQYAEAAYPQVVSTHSGIYAGWVEDPGDKIVKGTFFQGGYRVWSNPNVQPPIQSKIYLPIVLKAYP